MKYLTVDVAKAVKNFMNAQEYNGFAIHCPQKEQAEALLSALHFLGCSRWEETKPIISKDGVMTLNWKYKEKTCYRFFIDSFELYSAQKSFYEKKKFFIYTFDELMSQYGEKTEQQEDATQNVNTDTEKTTTDTPDASASAPTPEVTASESGKILTEEEFSKLHQETNGFNEQYPKTENASPMGTTEQEQQTEFPLLKMLNLRVNEPFFIQCDKILLFYPKTLYRFNKNCTREYLADVANNVWVPCSKEEELNYLVNHPEIMQKADGYYGAN